MAFGINLHFYASYYLPSELLPGKGRSVIINIQ